MLLRKGFHQVKVKYEGNQLAKLGKKMDRVLRSFFGYCQHMIDLNNLQKIETVDVLFPVAL